MYVTGLLHMYIINHSYAEKKQYLWLKNLEERNFNKSKNYKHLEKFRRKKIYITNGLLCMHSMLLWSPL